MASSQATRKLRGAWFTPQLLIDEMIDWLRSEVPARGRPLRVVDPACGDGRLLVAVRDAFDERDVELYGCDIDAATADTARRRGMSVVCGDGLAHDWPLGSFDIVIGNPPFLSQMAQATTRGGSSRHGGGPYADAAAEFVSLASELVRSDGGHIALVLPQSILGARDAGEVRSKLDARAQRVWSWWRADQRLFDASVNVCAIGWRTPARRSSRSSSPWTSVVTDGLGVPPIPSRLATAGRVGDRNLLNANFRDEYYALVPAVSDDAVGPPLVTSGLIDPAKCWWGDRSVRFNKTRFERPRVNLDALTGRFRAWADRKLVPKVLVANQTRVIEAVCDPGGDWLPGVPVTTLTPLTATGRPSTNVADTAWETAAVLTSPIASALMWHLGAGTGLSTSSVRVGPGQLAEVPWPHGDLDAATRSLRAGAVEETAELVLAAYGMRTGFDDLLRWWTERLPVSHR